MGVMDKFLNYMKLNDDEDEFYDEDYLDDEPIEEKPQKPISMVKEDTSFEEHDIYCFQDPDNLPTPLYHALLRILQLPKH